MAKFQARLASGAVLLLDGGVGSEIERRGAPMHKTIWSAAASYEHPDIVQAVHEDYIRAGADIITTNTYPAGLGLLTAAGMSAQFRTLNARGVELALRARESVAAERDVFVAGSISSWEGTPRPETPLPREKASRAFRDQAEILAERGVDLILLEQMLTVVQACDAAEAALSTGLPTVVGFSPFVATNGSLLISDWIADSDPPYSLTAETEQPTPFETVRPIVDLPISGVMVMHTLPSNVDPGLRAAREWWSGPLGAYAHLGHLESPHWVVDEELSPADYGQFAVKWHSLGARIIGACCGLGPEYIRTLKKVLLEDAAATPTV